MEEKRLQYEQPGRVGRGFHRMKHHLDETVMKAKEVLHSKSHRLHYEPVESAVQSRQDLTVVDHSRVPSLPALPTNLAQFSSMQLGSNLAIMPLNTSTGQNTRAGAAAQALEAPTPSTSNMTAPQASSNTVVSDGHVYDSNEGNSAVGTHGANLTASEQSSMMEHGARNTLMRDAFGDNGGIEDKNEGFPIYTHGIYAGVGFNKSLPALPDPFVENEPPQTNEATSSNASNGASANGLSSIDPFYASGPRVVLHSPYSMEDNDDEKERKIFSKQALIDLDHHTHHLEIDLFCPVGFAAIFPKTDLSPLWRLSELRSLKVVGMQRTYQSYIWEAVWKNPHIERLTMEMAEAPAISKRAQELGWHVIHGSDWAPRKLCEVAAKYRGDSKNRGRLHERNGWGEYLDVNAILLAKQDVEHTLRRDMPGYNIPAKLQLKKLSLSGFVGDGFVFRTCFDEDMLSSIDFGWDCVDAGLALSTKMMENVTIRVPESSYKS